jgi:hypothetical protein
MRLKVLDRLALLSILPAQGNFLTLSISDDIRAKVNFDAQERTALSLQQTAPGSFTWSEEADVGTEMVFSPAERDLIAGELKLLDQQSRLTPHTIGLYRMFVLGHAPA